MDLTTGKILIFVSTGRCGTTKIATLLKEVLPNTQYDVHHQIEGSRLFNIVGNLLFLFKFRFSDRIKEIIYFKILKRYAKHENFVISDPLTAMLIPKSLVLSTRVAIIQIERESSSFAKSMFQFTRKKRNSFIAHNFFPFWQPLLFPLENWLSANPLKKYEKISKLKNAFFKESYQINPNYHYLNFKDIFEAQMLQDITNRFFEENVTISPSLLNTKVNES